MIGRSPLRGSGLRPDGLSQSALSQAEPLVPNAIRERLLTSVGGMENFERSFNSRTFSPERRAQQNLADGVNDAEAALAVLSSLGATAEQADEWLAGFVGRWAKYQHAGARTMNWMITGPARFPVDRNNKRMEVEHRRSTELSEYVEGTANWIARRNRAAERREAVAADQASGIVHKEKVVNGVRVVLNKSLDRVQIIFPDKPTSDERDILKREAFRWAPSVGAWQRQLTQNGVWAAERALNKITAASGIETEGHDRADGHGAEHESPTGEAGDAQPSGSGPILPNKERPR